MVAQTQSEQEGQVWELLTRDFSWELPASLGVSLHPRPASKGELARFQLFEVAVAAIFARLRPEYEWSVSPDRPDGGLDFVGRHGFLVDESLGIAAAITVGGQCKKRTRVDDIVDVLAGSLTRMAFTVAPTFFVVALSARLSEARVRAAREILERTLQRHCHILDRSQLEGLLTDHLAVLELILPHAVGVDEASLVLSYFAARRTSTLPVLIRSAPPARVLSGRPFSVEVDGPWPQPVGEVRLWWRPVFTEGQASTSVAILGPIGVDGPTGHALDRTLTPNPRDAAVRVEMVTHAVGAVKLGEVALGDTRPSADAAWVPLGEVIAVDNVRPRFYDRPFVGVLDELQLSFDRAVAGGVASVAVVGAGGSGKSRCCEEFTLDSRRRGVQVVVAREAKTLDDPHRLLVELFEGLVPTAIGSPDPAASVLAATEGLDAALSHRAEQGIRTIFGTTAAGAAPVVDQSVLSALLLLLSARTARSPLIVHLQDLHWCGSDVLLFLERLMWQVGRIHERNPTLDGAGVLFVCEGRIGERQANSDGWASQAFEAFLDKVGCPVARCRAFDRDQSLEFVQRLFEDRYSAERLVEDALLDLQRDLIVEIDRSAGGNPFHTLAQVQLLKERRTLGQNPTTGLLYLLTPGSSRPVLPDSVFDAIELRWRDISARNPPLALLMWACTLLEDRVPARLFERLRARLAPDVSLHEVDATEILWTGGDGETGVTFRHENFFNAIRSFGVSADYRQRVVGVYVEWFAEGDRQDPADRYRWARALLELPTPDVAGAASLLEAAREGAVAAGDSRLARRISVTALDLAWEEDLRSPMPAADFLDRSDLEIALVRGLLGADRHQAIGRLARLRTMLERRRSVTGLGEPAIQLALRRRELEADVVHSMLLHNDRQPARAAEVSDRAVRGILEIRAIAGTPDEWDQLEMEALHARAVALALSGEIDEALDISAAACTFAESAPSPIATRVVSTFANILLARDPTRSEAILRKCFAGIPRSADFRDVTRAVQVNLAMSLVLQAHGLADSSSARLAEAEALLRSVFADAFPVGQYADAAGAALMLGIVAAHEASGEEVSWFAQAVAAASRGYKKETLWRAHINLATALYRRVGLVTPGVHEHARAALEIIEDSLQAYAQPERTARFELVRLPLAQCVRFLIGAQDLTAQAALLKYPRLRRCFIDVRTGALRSDAAEPRSHEWLLLREEYYILY